MRRRTYDNGDYIPATGEFQRQFIAFDLVHKWEYTLVFDGCPAKEKQYENQQHCDKGRGFAIKTFFTYSDVRAYLPVALRQIHCLSS